MAPDSSKHAVGGSAILSAQEGTNGRSTNTIFGSWPLLILAFGSLVALMIGSGLATLNFATNLYATLSNLNQEYRRSWRSLDEIRAGIHVSSVLVRDYLLDPSQSRAKEIREELLSLKNQTEGQLSYIERATGTGNREKLQEMRREIDAYWESLDPVFDWTPQEKQAAGYGFLRHRVMPRREAVLSLANEVQTFTDGTFQQEREETRRTEQAFRSFLLKTVAATVALGIAVAALSILRVRTLERRSQEQRRRTERAEDEMRRLSHQLVHAQEEERRSISRELHDEVGQMLTGLRMDLRSLQKLHDVSPEKFASRVEQTRTLLEQTLQAVRDIAMGLRPSMLDDLGLEAALRWQIREFERRHEIPITLLIRTKIDDLPDRHRTNLYRIVQEALTNCARHSRAHSVSIELAGEDHLLRLSIQDDGVGMKEKPSRGLGLVGIQERVRELGGAFQVESQHGHGTQLLVELPREALVHG